MIGINQYHKCKVWINENLASNDFYPLQEDEMGFIRHILNIFEIKTLNNKNTINFYR